MSDEVLACRVVVEGIDMAIVFGDNGCLVEENFILKEVDSTSRAALVFEQTCFRASLLFNSSLHSKEIDFDSINFFLFGLSLDVRGEEENVFGSSLVVKFNFSFSIEIKVSNRLPELPVVSTSLFGGEPSFVVLFGVSFEAFFG